MGIEEHQKKAQEEATRARKEFKRKVNRLAWWVLVIGFTGSTLFWYFGLYK